MDARAEGLPRQAPRALPDAAILSEEMGAAGRLRRWIVDPLDGTTNYAHGIPIFGVSIALETAAGETGVIYDPNRRTYVAERPRRW
jgi:myo-inositol-1(or 4)-monophosphatase